MSDYDGSRGYGSSGDRDPMPYDIQIGAIWEEIERLQKNNIQIPESNSDEGDEFVRKELISAYDCCEERDKLPLEYVIRMYSNPEQWKEFTGDAELNHYHLLGE